MIRKELLDLDPDEIVLHEIKKHPIGLLSIYFVTGFLLLLNFGLLFFAVQYDQEVLGRDFDGLLTLIFIGTAIALVVTGLIARFIYITNELIITNENIIQILQKGLFNRKISQLNLAKIQDVSADQNGVFPNYFNYGVINIETAGEAANYNFSFAPNPNVNAKHIIEAYEAYIKTHTQPGGGQPGVGANPTHPARPLSSP